MLKRFLKYYRPHIGLFSFDMASTFIMTLLDIVFPLLVMYTIDSILPQKNITLFSIACIIMVVMQLIRIFFSYVVIYWGHVLGLRMEYDMRSDVFAHVQKLSFSYFDNNKTGSIMSKIVNDLNEVSELAHHGPEDVFSAVFMIAGSLVFMFMMNVKLAFIVLLMLPVMIYFTIKKNIDMMQVFKETRVKMGEINSQVEQAISGIRVVKAFANECHERKKFDKGNKSFLAVRETAFDVLGKFYSGIFFFTNIIPVVVVIAGGILFLRGDSITSGVLIGFILFVTRFGETIRKILNLTEMYQRGLASYVRFDELMMEKPDIEDSKNAVNLASIKGEIEFNNITFGYSREGEKILDNFNLKVKSGENIALVGSSGAGKTTICSLIPRFYDVDFGEIKIDGINVKEIKQESLRKNIGIVQQDVYLFNGTLKENIAYGSLEASMDDVVKAAKLANIYDFIMSLDDCFETEVGERGVKLSGGQKQRIALARIFLKNPKILILDEATSALDNQTEKLIQESLSELTKGRTTVTIAHRLSTIRNADRIIVIGKDGIIETGSHDELLEKKGIYAELYFAQMDGFTVS